MRRDGKLGVTGEPRVESTRFHATSQHTVVVNSEGGEVEGFLRGVRQANVRAAFADLEPFDEVRRAFDGEVAPVVAVRQDRTTVVRVPGNPSRERCSQARMFDRLAVVKPSTRAVEDNRALTATAFGRGQSEKFGMVAWLHRSVLASGALSSSKHPESLAATRRYYDEFAARYDAQRGGRVEGGYHDLVDDLEIDFLQRFAAGSDVLEVGCGTGLLLERIATFSRRAEGVDLSPGMLASARERGLTVQEASATELPYADGTFDVTCSFKVLAHIEDIRRALSEMTRVTKRGGTVVAEFYNPFSLRALAKRIGPAGKVGETTTEAAVFTRFDRPSEAAGLLPSGTRLIDRRGVRIVTPTAGALRWPVLGDLLRTAEWKLCDSPLANVAGFWIGAFRKE